MRPRRRAPRPAIGAGRERGSGALLPLGADGDALCLPVPLRWREGELELGVHNLSNTGLRHPPSATWA
jgi:hypothetical protein